MTDDKQIARERQVAYERKLQKQKRERTMILLIIIGIAVAIFALGTLFGWHLTSHAQKGQATPTSTAYSRAVMELYEKWLGVLEVQQ